MKRWVPVVALAALLLAGCDKASTAPTAPTAPTVAAPAPSPVSTSPTAGPTPATSAPATAPVVAGPTTTADAACPLLSLAQAMDDIGERVGRITTSTSGAAAVGCSFYPIDGGGLATSEHLPPSTVPIISIATYRYADTTSAHNAMVEFSRVDPQAYQDAIPGVDEAISYAATFYAPDGTQDRAFTFRKGTTVAVVQIAQTTPAFNARHIGTDIAPAVT